MRIAAGKTNRMIADELGIPMRTMDTHVAALLHALGTSDRTRGAYLYARWEIEQAASASIALLATAEGDDVAVTFVLNDRHGFTIGIDWEGVEPEVVHLSPEATTRLAELLQTKRP